MKIRDERAGGVVIDDRSALRAIVVSAVRLGCTCMLSGLSSSAVHTAFDSQILVESRLYYVQHHWGDIACCPLIKCPIHP